MAQPPFSLHGKIALITGAAAGIGRATVAAFSKAGAKVIATDRDPSGLERLPAGSDGLRTAVLDVTDPDAIAGVVAQAGPIDILFNCAGIVPSGAVLDTTRQEWQRAFDINVTSIFDMSRAVLPGMIERGGGNIINVASVVSTIKTAPNRAAYAATKAAVVALTKSVALDYVGKGIRCNAICPGTVDTPSLEARIAATGEAEAARCAFVARQPMGRLGSAEEIAAAALYLASPESAFVTGHAMVIDGGFSL
ncbi:SDR family oxidoreductase [Mesorhizobium sp. B2-3-11]|uniref:SDR family oxidoreductase n=1 Tax=Mesorhizobium sp. B2-3-11 TaxID=2589953 RepID=UPI00112CDC75|nr:SDR family oxidoreductase [Mesorhizobium sp. B2-3-11]TPM07078.1 SDR family oxidoreductase [Mesorhizobium sp. B2-3-11]